MLSGCRHCVVLEETCDSSGIGASVAAALQDVCSFSLLNLGDGYTTHGKVTQLHKLCGLDADSVAEHLQEVLKNEN
jgi:deoxyxylulose-5-phosphate synthase